jgi:putative transcriptional regulator
MNKLKEKRLNKKYSLADMASILGISKSFYFHIENKKRRLSYEMALKIAKIFDLKPDELFFDDYNK